MRHIESKIQKACVMWFRLQYSRLALNLVAVPNGGARNAREAAIMKGEGVTAGVSDLVLFYPSHGYHGLCIEMKTQTGRQQPTQKQWQQAVEAVGYRYALCRSTDEFMQIVQSYLKPPATDLSRFKIDIERLKNEPDDKYF